MVKNLPEKYRSDSLPRIFKVKNLAEKDKPDSFFLSVFGIRNVLKEEVNFHSVVWFGLVCSLFYCVLLIVFGIPNVKNVHRKKTFSFSPILFYIFFNHGKGKGTI